MTSFLQQVLPPQAYDVGDEPLPNTLTEVAPVPTLQQEIEQEALGQPLGFDHGRTTVDDVFGAAVTSEWVGPAVLGYFGTTGFIPNFKWNPAEMSPELRKEHNIDGRPPEMVEDLFKHSVSEDHFRAMVAEQDKRLQAENILGRAGAGGLAARIAATFLDPVAIGVTIATDGFAAPLILSHKITRLQRAVRTGVLGAVSNAAIEASIAAVDPMRDETDVAIAAGAGLILGGAIGAAVHGRSIDILTVLQQNRESLGRSLIDTVAINDAAHIKGATVDTTKLPRVGGDGITPLPVNAGDKTIVSAADMRHKVVTVDADGNPTIVYPNVARVDVAPLPRTRDEVAMELNAPFMNEVTELRTLKKNYAAQLEEMKVQRLAAVENDATVKTLTRKIKNAGARTRGDFEAQLEARKKEILSTDTPEQAKLRSDLQEIDYKLRDVAPGLSNLMARADTRLAKEAARREAVTPIAPSPDAPVEVPTTSQVDTQPTVPDGATKIEGSAGAAGVAHVDILASRRVQDDMFVRYDGDGKPIAGTGRWKTDRQDPTSVRWQYDLFAMMARSVHDGISWTARQLMPNPVGYNGKNGRAQGRTVGTDKEMIHKTELGEAMRGYNSSYKTWADANGRWLSAYNIDARREFGLLVGRQVRQAAADADAAVAKAADEVRAFHARYAKLAREAQVAGFDELMDNPRYMMRMVKTENVIRMDGQIGTMQLRTLIARAIQHAPDRKAAMTLDEAERNAFLYVNWLKANAYEVNSGMTPAFNSGLVKKLRERLEAEINRKFDNDSMGDAIRSALTKEDIDEFIDGVKNVGQAGVISRGKFRMQMDETYSMDINGETRSISDLFEGDAERLMMKYSSEMSGSIALARHPELQIKSMSHWEKLMEDLKNSAQHYVGTDIQSYQKQMDALELMRRHLFGQPMHDMTARNSTLHRLMRDYNFTRLGNKFGFAQIAEFGNTLGQVGFRAMMSHMPILGKLRRDAISGKFDHQLLDEIDAILGIGVDRLLGHPSVRDLDALDTTSRVLGNVEDKLGVAKRITADFSGLSLTTDVFERLAAASAIQRFANMADNVGGKLSVKRLQSMGLETLDAERIFEQMRRHVSKVESGLTGRKIKSLEFDKWDDVEAREMFKTAIWTWSRRMIQRNDMGDLPMFMSQPLMQLMFQFRSFTLAAWGKQLLHGVRMWDAQTATTFAGSTLFGSLGYMALTYANSVGRADAEQYRAERLTVEKIGMMGFARGGYSSIAPSFFDTGMMFVGEEPLFSAGRTTGLSSDYFFGAPSIDVVSNAFGAAQGLVMAPLSSDYDFSRSNGRNLKALLPFQNGVVIHNALEMMIGGLPKRSRQFEN